jgi:3-phosphoshikimate 1-carboxyvinyltransferase
MSSIVRISGPARINGEITIPGDKSISHRVALLASIANGSSTVSGFASSADCQATLECISRLGIRVRRAEHPAHRLTIDGRGLRGYNDGGRPVELWAANSGSTIRMIAGLVSGAAVKSNIDGDDSLRRRPMRRIIEPLRLMGAQIEAQGDNYPPLAITGRPLKGITYPSPVPSAQIKTCILMAGLGADGTTVLIEPSQSRDHTELMLPEFGVPVSVQLSEIGQRITIQGGQELLPVDYSVPGDLSSAAFFTAGALLCYDSSLAIKRVGLNPTRSGFLDVLGQLGANIARTNVTYCGREAVGDLLVSSSGLSTGGVACQLSGSVIANIIDEIPMLAVLATQVQGRIEVREARELRIKESDRIRAVVAGIKSLGGRIEEFEDGFAIEGPQRLTGDHVDSYGDHRIAMAFSIAGLIATGTTHIHGAECAAVSLPEFFTTLLKLTGDNVVQEVMSEE